MQLFDSHCHLDDPSFSKDIEKLVHRANRAGVSRMTTIGVDLTSSRRAVAIAGALSGVYATVGFHPHDAKSCSEKALGELRALCSKPSVRAWGEIGLDYNRLHSPKQAQESWFVRQLEISQSLGLPVVLHERDSGGRLLEILQTDFSAGRTGVVHCFSGTAGELEAYLKLGLCIGVTGIVTMKQRGATLRRLVSRIPDDRLLIETDAPYLVPAPQKNKVRRNEPAFVESVLRKLAEVRRQDPALLAETTFQNASRLFGLDAPAETG